MLTKTPNHIILYKAVPDFVFWILHFAEGYFRPLFCISAGNSSNHPGLQADVMSICNLYFFDFA